MSPEDDWCDVEWFDCYLWRPQIGRDVVASVIYVPQARTINVLGVGVVLLIS